MAILSKHLHSPELHVAEVELPSRRLQHDLRTLPAYPRQNEDGYLQVRREIKT